MFWGLEDIDDDGKGSGTPNMMHSSPIMRYTRTAGAGGARVAPYTAQGP